MTTAVERLETTYRDYLQSSHDSKLLKILSELLPSVNLVDEGSALKTYVERGSGSIYTWKSGIWADKRCHVGPYPPIQAEFGDLWFDVVELTPMILIPNIEGHSKDAICWLAVRPVYMWQFRTFLHTIKWEIAQTDFLNVDDLMDQTRFNDADGMALACNLYHEEAATYALWFGKLTCGQGDLQAAKHSLTEEVLNTLLPDNFLLWEFGEFPPSEFIRIAVGRKSIDKSPMAQVQEIDLTQAEREALPDRMLFDEWERHENIGFSTKFRFQYIIGTTRLPTLGFEFIRLFNCAYRPKPK